MSCLMPWCCRRCSFWCGWSIHLRRKLWNRGFIFGQWKKKKQSNTSTTTGTGKYNIWRGWMKLVKWYQPISQIALIIRLQRESRLDNNELVIKQIENKLRRGGNWNKDL
ncbi:hypothetical protein LINPERPRIM_LOCUS37274 [Linum perenne]